MELQGRKKSGLHGFDSDNLSQIFCRLPPLSLAYCSTVCSSWHDAVNSSPSLWRNAYCLELNRVGARETVNDSVKSPSYKTDPDLRGIYIDEKFKSRLAHGRVSVRSWKAHAARVNCCRMIMGVIVSGSSDGMVRVWSANTLKFTEQYKSPTGASVMQIEFDEAKILGAAGRDVLVWSRTGNGRLLRRMGGQSEICSICTSDSELSAGCIDGTVRVFDLYSSRCTQIFRMHTEPVKAVVMDSTTLSMASGSNDGTVQLFDARSGQKIASLLRPSSMTGITSLHLKEMASKIFAGTKGGDLYCLDIRNRKTLWKARVPGHAISCLHSPIYSNSVMGVGGTDGTVKVFDIDSVDRIVTFQTKPQSMHSSPVLGMTLGTTKLVTAHADSSMALWHFGEPVSVPGGIRANYGRKEVVVFS